jgi:hypothetical protein
MGGGLMQLVAYGAQDVYLTGNPQITFWKVVYRRHTNFSMETIEHTLSGNPDFGRKAQATIIRNGDLAARVTLMVTVDNVSWDTAGDIKPKFAWVRRLGHALVKSYEVEIGGSKIDKQYGVWLDLWYELTHNVNQDRGYKQMIGDVEELTQLAEPDANDNVKDEYTMYIPLQFWFCRNSGLALPLIALQYHEVRINFEFEDVGKLIVWQTDDDGNSPPLKDLHMKEASILVEYVYLDSVERRRFAQVGHEYLIEQVQFTGDESITGNARSTNVQVKSKLGFNHPTKELIWAVRNATFVGDDRSSNNTGVGHPFLAYTHDDELWADALDAAANNLANGMLKMGREGVLLANAVLTDAEAYVVLTGTVVTADVPTNATHNIRFNIFINGTTNGASGLTFHRYALYSGSITTAGATIFNYADYLNEVQVNVDMATTSFLATVLSHELTMNDVSVPVDSNNLIDNRYNTNNTGNPMDVNVIQPHNYGLRLDGKGNVVASAGLQLNGHDRFDQRLGGYFNYVQPHQHHTRTPADGVNVYSFGLHPEQHQPSGTCNLSRIDNSVLLLTLVDPLRNTFGRASALTVDITDAKLWVFAFSYNVLRCLSGMAGLAYSN